MISISIVCKNRVKYAEGLSLYLTHFHNTCKIHNPVCCEDDYNYLMDNYRVWFTYLNQDESAFSTCLGQKLTNTDYGKEQLAWAGFKVWKRFDTYSHEHSSPASV